MERACSIEGCRGKYEARGWCNTHYLRWWRWGDPLAVHTLAPTEDPSYDVMHKRVPKQRGHAKQHACLYCGGAASGWAYDHADPDEKQSLRGPYSSDVSHYLPLCRPCHQRLDENRLEVLVA